MLAVCVLAIERTVKFYFFIKTANSYTLENLTIYSFLWFREKIILSCKDDDDQKLEKKEGKGLDLEQKILRL